MPKITFHHSGDQVTIVEAEKGQSILQIALDNDIPMEHACGGNGFCTTCMCQVRKGMNQLSPRNDREENMGIMEDPKRLSCQAVVEGNAEIELDVTEY